MEKVIAGGISERMILATFVFIIILAFVFVLVAWGCPNACRGIALMLVIFSGEAAEEDWSR